MKVKITKAKVRKFASIIIGNISDRKKSKWKRIRSRYASYYKRKVQNNVILYEAFYGRGMLCGPYALFKAFFEREDFKKYKHVWVIDDFEGNKAVLKEYKKFKNVKFVKFESRKYNKYLCTAKYLINNSTFVNRYIKKDAQVYINTWHGIPLKTMGYDMPDGNITVSNTIRNYLSADYLLSPNEFHTKMYTDSYKLNGIYEGKIIEYGQSRTDTVLNSDRNYVFNKLQKMGVNIDPNKKIILYAPTWKGTNFSNPTFDINEYFEFIETLTSQINSKEYQVLVKPHQAVYKSMMADEEIKAKMENKFIPATVDANELLSVTDILVSDYSSIFFDFLVTDRPILFYIPDLENYSEYRGMYIGVDELPGPNTDKLSVLCGWIKDIDNVFESTKANYMKVKEWACKYDNGQVSKQVLEVILDKKETERVYSDFKTEKKKILISRDSMGENGITHSLLSLLNQMDYDKYDVTVYICEPSDATQRKRILQIDSRVRVLTRTGTWNASYFEEVLKDLYFVRSIKSKLDRKFFPMGAFKTESKRCFGNTRFDYAIDFSGYSPYFSLILLNAESDKKFVWQHNDLVADRDRDVKGKKPNYKSLKMMFTLYPYYDRIVACGESVCKINRENLATSETKDRFTFVRNTFNCQRMNENLEAEVVDFNNERYFIESMDSTKCQLRKLPATDTVNFVTLGRISTEKNHEALVDAFALLSKEYDKARLFIIGGGALFGNVQKQVESLKLENKVIMEGMMDNPFRLMKECQCFILPSLHEGQPLVLLEARAVKLPVIVANFSTVKDSLVEGGQLLIDNDKDSIYKGMKEFMEGKVPYREFDLNQYNKDVLKELDDVLIS